MNWRGLISAALTLAACSSPRAPPAATIDAVAVKLAMVEPAAGGTTLNVTGTVRLKRETQLGFSTAGRIAVVAVREGEHVAAGQLLARLDPTGLDAAMQSARAEAVRTEADRQRAAKLLAQGWATRSRLESADAVAAAARSRVVQAGFDARLGRIAAPSAGVVLRRSGEPGQIVAAGSPVLTLGEIGSGYVLRLPVSDNDLRGIKLGQRAEVHLPALSPDPIAAIVGEIAARSDDRTGTFQVELRLPDLPGMRSGLIGTAQLTGAATGGPLAVPTSAVFSARADEGFVYVFVAASSTVATRLVRLGTVNDRNITITGGLQPGERVARTGTDRLRDGMKVQIVS